MKKIIFILILFTLFLEVKAFEESDILQTANITEYKNKSQKVTLPLKDFSGSKIIRINSSLVGQLRMFVNVNTLGSLTTNEAYKNIDVELIDADEYSHQLFQPISSTLNNNTSSIKSVFTHPVDSTSYFLKITPNLSSIPENAQVNVRMFINEYKGDLKSSSISNAEDLGVASLGNPITVATLTPEASINHPVADFYKFQVESNSVIEFSSNIAENTTSGVENLYIIYDSEKRVVRRFNAKSNSFESPVTFALKSGSYFIAVYNPNPAEDHDLGFSLEVLDEVVNTLTFSAKLKTSTGNVVLTNSGIAYPDNSSQTRIALANLDFTRANGTIVRLPIKMSLNKADPICKSGSALGSNTQFNCKKKVTVDQLASSQSVSVQSIVKKVKANKNKVLTDVSFKSLRGEAFLPLKKSELEKGRFKIQF